VKGKNMTKREIAALICKVLGIYAFIGALNSLPFVFMPAVTSMVNASSGATPTDSATRLGAIINALPVVLHILAGLFLWLGADNLARRMVKDADTVAQSVIGQEVQIVAFSSLGLFTLLQAVPRVGQIVTNFYILSQQDALMRREFKGLTAPDIVGLLIQLALGLWLLFGTSGLVKMLQSFRSVGMDKQNRAAVDTQ
jgi:hypothetical protein